MSKDVNTNTTTEKKLDELYELIEEMDIAMMTTRRSDGMLFSRPMATQAQGPTADLWFVTLIDTGKVEQIQDDPNVSINYYNSNTREWVSVSGKATLSQDREKIRELYSPDWKLWFSDEGGNKDGGPDDPRLALIFVDAYVVNYMKNKHSQPRTLFELARSAITGDDPDISREERLSSNELK